MVSAKTFKVSNSRWIYLQESSINKCPLEVSIWNDNFINMMDKIEHTQYGKDIILLGDFNIDLLNRKSEWDSIISLFNLQQIIQDPTRITDSSRTLIDHIYVNNHDRIQNSTVLQTSMSDYFIIQCTLTCRMSQGNIHTHSIISHRSFKHFDNISFLSRLK